MITAVSRHLDLYHKFDVSLISFIVLAIVPKDPRGGEWDKHILQKETLWIEHLGAIYAPGINEFHTYKPFLLFSLVLLGFISLSSIYHSFIYFSL